MLASVVVLMSAGLATTASASPFGTSCPTMAVVSGVAFSVSAVPAAGVMLPTLTSGALAPLGSVTPIRNGAVLPVFSVQL